MAGAAPSYDDLTTMVLDLTGKLAVEQERTHKDVLVRIISAANVTHILIGRDGELWRTSCGTVITFDAHGENVVYHIESGLPSCIECQTHPGRATRRPQSHESVNNQIRDDYCPRQCREY